MGYKTYLKKVSNKKEKVRIGKKLKKKTDDQLSISEIYNQIQQEHHEKQSFYHNIDSEDEDSDFENIDDQFSDDENDTNNNNNNNKFNSEKPIDTYSLLEKIKNKNPLLIKDYGSPPIGKQASQWFSQD